jgi:hypothetical protein
VPLETPFGFPDAPLKTEKGFPKQPGFKTGPVFWKFGVFSQAVAPGVEFPQGNSLEGRYLIYRYLPQGMYVRLLS